MGHTVAEKLLGEKAGKEVPPTAGEYVTCDIDVAMLQDVHAPDVLSGLNDIDEDISPEPELIVVFDHVAPSHSHDDADRKAFVRSTLDQYSPTALYDVGTGISHLVLPEKGHIRPGDLVIGTDSHTVSHGVFGAAGTGVGDTDMMYALLTGELWFKVPPTINIHLSGELAPHVTTKDLMLKLADQLGIGAARYRAIEFTGEAITNLGIDDRMTLTNMSIELGAKFAFTPVDSAVHEFLDGRVDDSSYAAHKADPDASYERRIDIDVGILDPQVAAPHDVDNVHSVTAHEGVPIDQVFLGSCTNGSYTDLALAAQYLEGKTVKEHTRLIVTPASREIYQRALETGVIDTFIKSGATVTNPSCGACLGLGMGVLGAGERCFATQNRNYRGRMGSSEAEIYLGSPATAATTAVAGEISDPRGYTND